MALKKQELFQKRRLRVRNKLRAMSNGRPRLSVHRSSKNIYAQVIDDVAGRTLAAASTLDAGLRSSLKTGADVAAAAAVGKLVAERASQAGVKEVVFDRGPYIYHGRVKALAEAAEHLSAPQIEAVREMVANLAPRPRGRGKPRGPMRPEDGDFSG